MVQLRVSALDNDHLQVVHEILFKQLYKTYMGCLYGKGGGKVALDLVSVGKVGWCEFREGSMLLPRYV